MPSHPQRMCLVILLTFLLRTTMGMEKPEPTAMVNRSVALVFGISQQRGNDSHDYASTVREPKARKMDSYQNWNITTSTDQPVSLAVQSAPANKSDKHLSVKTTSSPRTETIKTRRSTPHRKYPNHHYSVHHSSEREDKRKIYVTNEDYTEQQYQNYQQDYYVPQTHEYEDPYNTVTDDQSHTGYDGVISDPYYHTYAVHDPGYFGPPIPGQPVHEEPPHDVHTRGCHCPETRQMTCDNSSADFIALVGALGANLWALIQLIATSSLPFIIPLLIIKLILVPLGIIKFLALIKIFFKLFIILPFFVRHIYPALTQTLNLHGLLFQKIQDVASHVHEHDHDHEIPHPHDEDIESRNDLNATSAYRRETVDEAVDDTSIWDLRDCPSRVACELGAFLSSSTHTDFPKKLVSYLSKRADRVEGRSKSDDDDSVDYEDEDEEQDRIQQRDQAFKAFVVALGKKWTQEQCVVYSCSVLF